MERTNLNALQVLRELRKAGAQACIQQPCPPERLLTAIAHAVGEKESDARRP